MTYAQLLIEILQMNREQLQSTVTVLCDGEFHGMNDLHFSTEEIDELDLEHPYLSF